MAITSPRDNLTKNERTFVKERLSGRTKTQAAKIAYPNNQNPTQYGSEIEAKPRIKSAILTALEAQGITAEFRAKNLKQIMTAEHPDFGPEYKLWLDAEKHVASLEGDTAKNELHLHKHEHTVTEKLYEDLDKGILDA